MPAPTSFALEVSERPASSANASRSSQSEPERKSVDGAGHRRHEAGGWPIPTSSSLEDDHLLELQPTQAPTAVSAAASHDPSATHGQPRAPSAGRSFSWLTKRARVWWASTQRFQQSSSKAATSNRKGLMPRLTRSEASPRAPTSGRHAACRSIRKLRGGSIFAALCVKKRLPCL